MKEEKKNMDCLDPAVTGKGISRRDFMKYCGVIAAALGLDASFIPKIAQALEPGQRPPVIWLSFAHCTGCSESFLRHHFNPLLPTSPTNLQNLYADDLILGSLSLEYHETIMAPSGQAATANLQSAVSRYNGEFICVCEGAIPTADNGVYGMVGNKTMLQIARDVCPKAKAVICYGTCASFGGLPAAAGNLTGAQGVHTALGGFPTINIPGCPPNPVNLVATIVNYLLSGSFPALDTKGRPTFAYGIRNHGTPGPLCERRFTDRCLLDFGCRGRVTYNNCSSVKFNDGAGWPVKADAPCYGCSEPDLWDKPTAPGEAAFFQYDGSYVYGI